MGLSSGSAKKITEITADRIKITHSPPRFVQVYVDPRQNGDAMEEEAVWIMKRILQGEKAIKEVEELKAEISINNIDSEYPNNE